MQEKRARKICGSDSSFTIVGANVIILTGEKNVNKQIQKGKQGSTSTKEDKGKKSGRKYH